MCRETAARRMSAVTPRRAVSCPGEGRLMVREDHAAAVVAEVMLALGVRGHDVAITARNGPRLLRLGALMLAEFGLADDVAAASGDGDDQALVAEQRDRPAARVP
jgi:hypothetical protein